VQFDEEGGEVGVVQSVNLDFGEGNEGCVSCHIASRL
jgi:hypothetical protein